MKILFLGVFSFILNYVFGQCPDAGIDTDTTICPSSAPLDLLTLVNGNPDQGGYWYYHNDEQAVTSNEMKYEACSHGQGINDILVVSADKSVNIVESFEIFSRWGEMVYSVKNFIPNEPQTGWDGTHDNKNLPTGVFAYKLVSTDKTGNKTIARGDITLIR